MRTARTSAGVRRKRLLPPAAARQALAQSGRALIAAAEASQPIGIELYCWAVLAREALDTAQLLALFLVMVGSCYRTVEDGEGDRWVAAGQALQAVLNDEQFGRCSARQTTWRCCAMSHYRLGTQRRIATRQREGDDIAVEQRDLRAALDTLGLLERRSPLDRYATPHSRLARRSATAWRARTVQPDDADFDGALHAPSTPIILTRLLPNEDVVQGRQQSIQHAVRHCLPPSRASCQVARGRAPTPDGSRRCTACHAIVAAHPGAAVAARRGRALAGGGDAPGEPPDARAGAGQSSH